MDRSKRPYHNSRRRRRWALTQPSGGPTITSGLFGARFFGKGIFGASLFGP